MDISVLISTRNRASLLGQTLTALARQQFPASRWEAIVVDNGSTDGTADVLCRFRAALPLVALAEPVAGKNRALNRAVHVARGELLVFTDDDVIPDERWLAELWSAAERWPEFSIFGAPIVPRFEVPPPRWLQEHPFAPKAFGTFRALPAEAPLPPGVRPFGANFAVRARALSALRFDEAIGPQGANYAMGSEVELIQRLFDTGERALHVPSAPVEHVVTASQVRIESLFDRAFRAGRGDIRLKASGPHGMTATGSGYLWRKVSINWVLFQLHRWTGEQARFDAGIRFHRARGRLFEARAMAAERRSR